MTILLTLTIANSHQSAEAAKPEVATLISVSACVGWDDLLLADSAQTQPCTYLHHTCLFSQERHA